MGILDIIYLTVAVAVIWVFVSRALKERKWRRIIRVYRERGDRLRFMLPSNVSTVEEGANPPSGDGVRLPISGRTLKSCPVADDPEWMRQEISPQSQSKAEQPARWEGEFFGARVVITGSERDVEEASSWLRATVKVKQSLKEQQDA